MRACVHSAIVTCTCTCTCMYVQCIPYSTRGNCAKNCVCRFLLPVSRKCNCYTLIHHLDISIDHQFKFRFNSNFATCEEQQQKYSLFIHLFIYSLTHSFMDQCIQSYVINVIIYVLSLHSILRSILRLFRYLLRILVPKNFVVPDENTVTLWKLLL